MSSLDYCIIGGGLSGTSCAYWLRQKHSNAKIALVEKKQLAYGASGRNAGFLTCGSINFYASLVNRMGIESATKVWRFCEENLKMMKDLIIQGQEQELEYSQGGSYSLFKDEHAFMRAEATVSLMNDQGIDARLCDKIEVNESLHFLHFCGGAHFSSDAAIDPERLTRAIFAKSQVDYMEGEVTAIEPGPGGSWRIRTSTGTLTTQNIIVGMNPFTYQLFPELKSLMRPVRAQILETSPTDFELSANVYACDDLAYFRRTPRGSMIVGGLRHLDSESEETDQMGLNALIQEAIVQKIKEYFPVHLKVNRQWSGIMAFSRDHLPHMGQIPSSPNIYFLGGYSGHGMGMAFNTARCLVQWIDTGETNYRFLLRAQHQISANRDI